MAASSSSFTFYVRVPRVFNNLPQIWREGCQIGLHQNRVSGFYFLRSFKSYDPSKKEKGYFVLNFKV